MAVILGRKPGGSGGGGGAPSGPAGGSLAGTYPNPTIAAGAVDTAELANDSVDADKIDGADAADIRTLLGVAPGAVLFDSTLGVAAADIDTGANGIAGGYNVLKVYALLRTAEAAAVQSVVSVTVNNDTGGNYDLQNLTAVNAGVAAATGLAGTNWAIVAHGDGGAASYAAVWTMECPGYTQTSFFKNFLVDVSWNDSTAGNNFRAAYALTYKSTSAITRMKLDGPGANNLMAGSRLLIYGI